MVAPAAVVVVSIAKAILFGFKHHNRHDGRGNRQVSIAKAILFGFKRRHGRPERRRRAVSIAKAILFGFKHCGRRGPAGST